MEDKHSAEVFEKKDRVGGGTFHVDENEKKETF